MLPSEFLRLPSYEKAFVIASIDIRVEEEKKERRNAENKVKH